MTDKNTHFDLALDNLAAADNALSGESETARLRKAQIHATLARTEAAEGDSTDLAWRVHDTAAESIGKADAKAGFVATLDTAVLAGVVTVANLDKLTVAGRVLVWLGGGLLAVALVCAVAVVIPILRVKHTKAETPGDFLYFGAVRLSTPQRLATRLVNEETTEAVCAQSITLSRLAWRKHRLLQAAMLATIVGANLIAWTQLMAGGAR